MALSKTPPLILVDWIDSWTHFGWTDPLGLDVPYECRSVGYLLGETDASLVLAASLGENGRVSGHITIPKACVKRRRRLKDPMK
jgi:hypothetical protein